jgi:protein-disulfide isomerase
MRIGRVLILSVVIAALAGCAGDASKVLTTGAPLDATATVDKAAFNPFSTEPETATGAREVIPTPTLAEVLQPASSLPEMSFGNPSAPLVLIKYMSLTCPYCKRFHAEVFPELKRAYIDTGKVRFVMREFPIGKASGTATVALRCAPADKYLALYGKFLEQQSSWVSQEVRTDQIGKVAAQVGVTGEAFSACLADKKLVADLNAIKERGRKLGIIGTPNFYLDNRLIKSTVDWPALRALIDARLAGGPAVPVAKVN